MSTPIHESHPAAAARRPWTVVALATAAVLVHLVPDSAYGYFRDELYYLACARRLAWGYVDHPPLSILVLRLVTAAFGDSVLTLRLLPALAHGASVVLGAATARRLGGSGWAQSVTALAVAVAPIYLLFCDFYSMNAYELLAWALALLLVARIIAEGKPRLWLAVGVLFGLGLENKHTMVTLGLALGVGLLLTSERKQLREKWLWLGVLAAIALVVPNLIWQQANGWPSLEFYRQATLQKNIPTTPLKALLQQALVTNFGALPLTVAGFVFLLRAPAGRALRPLGWTCLVLLALLLASGTSRPDRVAGMYPLLYAAGAVALEARRRKDGAGRWVSAVPWAVGLVGLGLAPLGISALPPRVPMRYMEHMASLVQGERGHRAPLPQWLADRTSWPQIVGQVEQVYDALPAAERASAILYAENYGEAGALEHFGPARGLPRVISNHNSYFHWSARAGVDAPVAIALGADRAALERLFARVERAGETHCELCMTYEDGVPIYVASEPKEPLSALWPRLKNYN